MCALTGECFVIKNNRLNLSENGFDSLVAEISAFYFHLPCCVVNRSVELAGSVTNLVFRGNGVSASRFGLLASWYWVW